MKKILYSILTFFFVLCINLQASMIIDSYKFDSAPVAPAFVPTDFSGCIVWLDGSDRDTVLKTLPSTPAGDGEAVRQWSDKSGEGNHFGESTGTHQPVYDWDTDGIEYAGANPDHDRLTCDTDFSSYTDCTIFIVRKTSNTSTIDFTEIDSSGTYGPVCKESDGSTDTGVSVDDYYADGVLQSITTRGDLYTAYNTGAIVIMTLSGVSLADYNAGLQLARYSGGGGFSFDGFHYEIIIYDSKLSPTDRGTVTTYLGRWL